MASEKDQAKRVSDLFVCKGVPDHIRSDSGKIRDELLQRQAFDTLLEANGALRAVAAAHQHDPTAQCLGLPAQGASRRGWSIERQNPNLRK